MCVCQLSFMLLDIYTGRLQICKRGSSTPETQLVVVVMGEG